MSIALKNKDVSAALMLIVVGIEFTIFIVAFVLDICLHLPLITTGRVIHYFCLGYYMFLIWSGLSNGRIEQRWQLLLFAIIPNIEFFVINIMGHSNLWGLLFLAVYGGVIVAIFHIDLNSGSSSGASGYGNKFIKSAIKGLTK